MKLNRSTVATMLATTIMAASAAQAQVSQSWDARYNGSANGTDFATSIAVDKFGNTIVTGTATESGSGFDAVTRSYSPTGSVNWTVPYDGPVNGDDYGVALVVDNLGNTYVALTSEGSSTGNDIVVLKISPGGAFSSDWASTGEGVGVRRFNYSRSSDEVAYDIAIDHSGNVYVVGTTDGNNTQLDSLVIKIEANGNVNPSNWPAVYNSGNNKRDIGRAIAIDNGGNVVIAGSAETSLDDKFQWLIIRYQGNGSVVSGFPVLYSPVENKSGGANDVVVDARKDIYVTGWANDSGDNKFVTASWELDADFRWVDLHDANTLFADNTVSMGNAIALEVNSDAKVIWVNSAGRFEGLTATPNNDRDYEIVKHNASTCARSDWPGESPDNATGVRRYNAASTAADEGFNVLAAAGKPVFNRYSAVYQPRLRDLPITAIRMHCSDRSSWMVCLN